MNESVKFHKLNVKAVQGRLGYYKDQLNLNERVYTVSELHSLLDRLRNDYAKFSDSQVMVEMLDSPDDPQLHETVRLEFEKEYNNVESIILKLLDAKSNKIVSKSCDTNENPVGGNPVVNALNPLSLIDVPKFDGRFESWINFRVVYEELIHNNASLTSVIKFQYLRHCLKGGSADHFVDGISASLENYQTVWNTIFNHYENNTRLKFHHMGELYNLQPIKQGGNLSREIQMFITNFWKQYNALKALDCSIENWDLYLVHHVCQLVDNESLKQIETKRSSDRVPTIKEVMDILTERARLLETLSQKRQVVKVDSKSQITSVKVKQNDVKRSQAFVANDNSIACIYCKSDHYISSCSKFRNLPWADKNEFVVQNKLCRKCFSKNHFKNKCKSKNCKICSFPHHTILHSGRDLKNGSKSEIGVNSNSGENLSSVVNENSSHDICAIATNSQVNNNNCNVGRNSGFVARNSQVLLPTVVLWIYNSMGIRVPCRALIDSGAQSNFISNQLYKNLNIKGRELNWSISGIGKNECVVKYSVSVKIDSRISNYSRKLDCLVLSEITRPLPSYSFKCDLASLSKLELGDPHFYESRTIDLLLGADVFSDIILGEKVSLSKELPPFVNTRFGYIVCGKLLNATEHVSNNQNCAYLCCDNDILNKSLQRFWNVENVSTQNNFSLVEKACERSYVENVSRNADGRFIVALPFTKNVAELGESKTSALRQFHSLEVRLRKNPVLFQRYSDFMNEYISLKHMSRVDDDKGDTGFFLPHHPVLKESSTTTKLRVVFNASLPSKSGLSLNDVLLTGPIIQPDLMSLLLNFRKYRIALTGDIAKMYRQVLVRSEDRKYQRIFWRSNMNEPVALYELNTVTYGMASASFLAIRSLQQLAMDEFERYPTAASILTKNFYVDDLLTGADCVADAIKLKNDLESLLKSGGFELRKWVSNQKDVVPCENDDDLNVVTTLGVTWNSTDDTFQLPNINIESEPVITKRIVLRNIAKFFDPLGLASPIIFYAKKFMQSLWSIPNLTWDDPLMEPYVSDWLNFSNELKSIVDIRVPRCITSFENVQSFEIHGFGDASESGYGACIYVRSKPVTNSWECRLLCAKSRVAPVKKLTMPRLELMAALLLAELYQKVRDSMNINVSRVTLYTDSTITLSRINSSPSRYATFVANRVTQIQDIANPSLWAYIPSEINPADLVSRGIMPSQITSSDIWWYGPAFLYESGEIENYEDIVNDSEDPEIINHQIISNVQVSTGVTDFNFDLFDNYEDVIRAYAFCLRFFRNCRKNFVPFCGELSVEELENSMKCIIRSIQRNSFREEIELIEAGQILKKRHKQLAKLNPFLDSDRLLRVGGRIVNSNLSTDQKHPYMLPANNTFCRLLVKSIHLRNLHIGPTALISFVRQRFWILNLRQLCKNICFNCIRCFRTKPKNIQQLMGQLPSERVEGFRVFENVGIDMCGPFYITSKIRSKAAIKAYVCLFVCFSTKACHLEVVDELSTKSFLMALQRFVGRRSMCSNIFSDNATNFIGARNELDDLKRLFDSQQHKIEVMKFCTNNGINWKTIPARSPHFGGLWEAGIKSAKHLLKRELGNYKPTLDELQTIVVQVEACLNSRPLTPLSEDPSDLSVLTPGHFLVGKPLNALPEPSILHINFNRLSHYQRMTSIVQSIWARWHREYLSGLQSRAKWLSPTENIEVGNLVLLKEDNLPPLKWVIGRVVEVHPGLDDVVRVVTVRTATGLFKRAITRVCVLPMDNNHLDSEHMSNNNSEKAV